MCGIAGWVDWERDLTQQGSTLNAMATTMACRGPDAQGTFADLHCAFGHRRLIVVDPAGGLQPMTRTFGDDRYTMVYNGELYNTEEVRRDLRTRGYTFQSYSDTEVLLVAFVAFGTECVHRLNGIFAFAIWDESNQTLFMARDRLGVKPLFYCRHGSSLILASELKALLAHPQVSPTIDAEGLAEIFAIGPARTPGHGIYKDVRELRAGHWLLATAQKTVVRSYWQLESRPHADDLEDTAARVRELLVDTVRRQLVSDVPVCTFLSGGLDSSAVSAIAAQVYQEEGRPPLDTYSVEFADMEKYFQANSFQKSLDAPWAMKVSDSIASRHHRIVFDMPEMVEHLLTPLSYRDLPGMADIDTSLYLFCREIRRHHTVALSGESADEVFGGYPWFHRAESLDADTFPWSLKMQERMRILSPELKSLIRPEEYVADRYRDALAEVPRIAEDSSRDARIREISYLSITRFLPTLLDRKDRMSMASGLEVRVPFCDHRLVDYVFNIPWDMKACDDQTKGILRRAMNGYLPTDVLCRPKSPYPSTPDPRYLEATRSRALALLADPDSPLQPLIDAAAVRELATTSYQPTEHRPWFGQIMATAQMFHYLLEVDAWMRQANVQVV